MTRPTRPKAPAAAEPTPSETNGGAELKGLDRSDLAEWLSEHAGVLATRWLVDVDGKAGGLGPDPKALLAAFYDEFMVLLPACMGPYRSQFEPVWRQCAELYGSVGAMRGLASGEIIDEFQIVREATIRLMFATPPSVRGTPLLMREILRLNRVIDRGVTFANVGYTDALFFALFKGSGAPKSLTDEQLEEVREQLGAIRKETRRLLALLAQ